MLGRREPLSQANNTLAKKRLFPSEEALFTRYGIRSEVVGQDGVRFAEEYASSTPGTYAQVLEKLREQGQSYPWVVIVSSGNDVMKEKQGPTASDVYDGMDRAVEVVYALKDSMVPMLIVFGFSAKTWGTRPGMVSATTGASGK